MTCLKSTRAAHPSSNPVCAPRWTLMHVLASIGARLDEQLALKCCFFWCSIRENVGIEAPYVLFRMDSTRFNFVTPIVTPFCASWAVGLATVGAINAWTKIVGILVS